MYSLLIVRIIMERCEKGKHYEIGDGNKTLMECNQMRKIVASLSLGFTSRLKQVSPWTPCSLSQMFCGPPWNPFDGWQASLACFPSPEAACWLAEPPAHSSSSSLPVFWLLSICIFSSWLTPSRSQNLIWDWSQNPGQPKGKNWLWK